MQHTQLATASPTQRRFDLTSLRHAVMRHAGRLEPLAYAAFAAVCTLVTAAVFFTSMKQQVSMLYSALPNDEITHRLRELGPWSAPLDDVFIHFDFARSAARGYPFEWSETNGYSSGGTSLLYPLVLAIGYWAGFRQLWLMLWAGIVACTCVFGLLLAGRRLFRNLPAWTSYGLPPVLLGVGALDWTFYSGMEVALLMGVWSLALIAWDDLLEKLGPGSAADRWRPWRAAVLLGLAGSVIVATRPEGVTAVAAFVLGATAATLLKLGLRTATKVAAASCLPPLLILLMQSAMNRWLTGDSAAAGALAKLELHHPFMTTDEILGAWWFHLKYQVFRITEYHLSDDGLHGWIVWGLAAVALVPRATRRYALLLWSSAAAWVLLVALNGQVRWQNERYTMPALAWLLLSSALGLGVLLSASYGRTRTGRALRVFSVGSALTAVSFFALHQHQRFVEQVWFFGRASRNILEQHVRVGLKLRYQLVPTPHRVMVGDAGAIPYASDLPALDIIGLGGYHALPFARAARLGVPAALELVERVPSQQRPDLMALYPSWWGELPLWFGRRITEVTVHGNVICGGPSKVLYAPDWRPMDFSAKPFLLRPGERIVDALDFADLVSEREHSHHLSRPRVGHVHMKLLDHPRMTGVTVWDAGRELGPDVTERFRLRGFEPGRPARLLIRAAPSQPTAFSVIINDHPAGTVTMQARDTWQEQVVTLAGDRVESSLDVRIEGKGSSRILHHLWAVQSQ